jgi:hypothetical protein
LIVEVDKAILSPTVTPVDRSIFGPDVRLAEVLAPLVRTVVLPAVKTRLADRVDSKALADAQTETSSELPSSPGYLPTQSPTPEIPEE